MKKIVVLLTACLLIVGASLSVAAQVVAPTAALDYEDLDFRESPSKTATVQIGEVLDNIDGVTLSQQEKNFIRYEYSGQHVLYYTKPALIDKQYAYDGEHRCLTVTLMQDSYQPQKHDEIVVWTPHTVKVGDAVGYFAPAPDLGTDYYRAVIEDIDWSADMVATIEYSTEFEISAQTLNEFVNFAYEQSLLLHDEYQSLEARLAAYRVLLEAYEQNRDQWTQYQSQSDQYELYLAKVAMYKDYLAYQNYLTLLGKYHTEHEAYLANQSAWAKYEADYAKYGQYLKYKNEEYPALNATVQHQLELLALLEKEDPNTGISFIEMMMDDRIATMIEEKRTLVSGLVGDGPVDNVSESTAWFQKFCTTYQSLSTDQEKYAFYISECNKVKMVSGVATNDSLVKHLRQLYNSIKKLYETDAIYNELQRSYPEHITTLVRLLGSLYVQRCMFDDTVTFNPNETVDKRGNQKASALVHESVRPTSDTNKATPLSAYPKHPDSYEVRVEPVKPSQRLEDGIYPTKPEFTYVKHEDELDAYMEDPGHMDKPTAPEGEPLQHPGPAPSLTWSATQQDLHDAYLAGLIVQRPEFTESQKATIYATNQFTIQLGDDELRYYVHFYNTDDQGTYLGHSLGVKYGEAATIPAELLTAQKSPELTVAYEFAGWVDRNGDPLDISCLTDDIDAYASYRTVPRKYNVTWVVGNGTIVQQCEYGATPVFEGSTDKQADARYEYTFNGWDREIVPVTSDVTYTAQYKASDRRYSVTFDMGDGTAPIVREYLYGQSLAEVVAALSKPYLAPTAQYSYTFKGWKDAKGNFYSESSQFPQLTEAMVFTALFDQTVNSYTVTWIVDGVPTQTTWLYGETPRFGEDAQIVPVKETDERYHYTFKSWDKEITAVVGDATYTAQFDSTVRLYRVDFVVEGQTLTLELEYEQLPVFEGTPQKDSDVQYDYTFIGWDREPVPVREDAIYVAEFGKVVRKYPVKFVVGGSEVSAEFEYGKVPKYPNGTPIKADDDTYCYVFTDWDKPLAAVDGSEVVYTAIFQPVPLAPTADGQNGKLHIGTDGAFELTIPGTQADLSLIFDKAGREQAQQLEVFFGDASLVFSKSLIDAFYLMGNSIASVTLAPVEHAGGVAYRVELLDHSGEPVSYLVTELTVKLPSDAVYAADVFRAESDGTLTKLQAAYKDGYLEFSTMDFCVYVIKDKFLIEKNPTENGVFDAIGEAYAGDVITVSPNPDEGYHVDSVKVECNGQQIEVEAQNGSFTFVMPDGNVSVTTTFKVVEGGSTAEVIVGVVTALLIVAIGFVIAIVLHRRKAVRG